MSKRITTAQLGEKLDKLIELMTAQAIQAPPVATPESPTTEGGSVKVDSAYLAHMNAKAADHATAKGSEVVLYARQNQRGETKLAYALRDRFDEVVSKQPSCKGAVGSFQP